MKSLKEFNADLKEKSEKHLGYNLSAKPQRSEEWLKSRLGVITASKAIALFKDGRKSGTVSALWETYQLELISEIATKSAHHTPLTLAIEHGNTYEHEAKELFKFETSLDAQDLTFCYRDDMRAGASPDLINNNSIGEIKAPYNTSYHLKFLIDDTEIKPEYIAQMEFQMWVLGCDTCYFISYDPRVTFDKIKYLEIVRSPLATEKLEERTAQFIKEMDIKLDKLNLEWGSQWKD